MLSTPAALLNLTTACSPMAEFIFEPDGSMISGGARLQLYPLDSSSVTALPVIILASSPRMERQISSASSTRSPSSDLQ